ncbi:AAA family ATPase [Streptomyces sp. NBC_01578]|uniref:AAA family ATPase n=1 Tax=Streptomyces sp. NBC_01578 TaxID=2975884 RepID=UPI0038680229
MDQSLSVRMGYVTDTIPPRINPDGDDGPVDPAQLTRITSLHRGFLYQHLYAVGCLLSLNRGGVDRLLVERDEDVEAVLADRRLYMQIKTRSRALQWGDISSAIENFESVRARHAAGIRPGRPQLIIVSNQVTGPGLAQKLTGDDWPNDVTILTPGAPAPDSWLPPAWETVDEAVAWCSRQAARVPFASLAPQTLVWKLAARVVLACTGHGGQMFNVSEMPALYEQFVQELQAFPAPPAPYLPQATEPELLTAAKVRLITGFSGSGKTAWASHAATHCPEPITYFDVSALSRDAVAGALARELAARHLNTAQRAELLHGAGIDVLRAVHQHLAGTPVAIVIDNVHRLNAADLRDLASALPSTRLVLLGQPRPDQAAFAAHIGIATENLNGWTADSVAGVFADAECPVDRPTAERLVTLTGGLPLYVCHAAALTRTHYDHDAASLCTELSQRCHSVPSVQDLILEEVFASLDPTARTVAFLLAMAEVPLTDQELRRLAHAAELSGPACSRGTRTLTAFAITQRTGRLLTLHDAARSLATEYGPAGSHLTIEHALSGILRESIEGGSAPVGRLAKWAMLLARTDQTEQLLELASHDLFFEQSFSADLAPILTAVATDKDAAPVSRFDALNALALLAYAADETTDHGRLVDDLAALAAAHSARWGTRERLVLATHRMIQHASTGDLGAMNTTYLATRSETAENSVARRILRYTQAQCFFIAGRYEQSDILAMDVAEAYLDHLGLKPEDVLGVGVDELGARLGQQGTDLDDCKRLADCLALTVRCKRELDEHHGLAALHAMKFFHLAGAWRSVVTIGQEVVDDFVEIGDLQQALQLLEQTLLPLVQQHALDDLVIGLRSQRAVVIAHTGDYAAARAELDTLQRYDVPLQQAQEIENQRALIEHLAT